MPELWPQPVLDLIREAGDRTVFEDGARQVSGAEMYAMIRTIADGLRRAGSVVLHLGVHPEAFAAILAAFAAGARVSGVRADQLGGALAGGDTLIDEDRLAALLRNPDPGGTIVARGRPDDVARILWTSGSTGTPKGCVQTYASMTAAWAPYPDRWPPAVRELASRLGRYLVFGSLFSQVMLEYGVLALAAGGTLVAARKPVFPDMITEHRATASVITVGKLHQLVARQRDDPADLSTLRALMVSGSPLAPARLTDALTTLGPVLFHGYGQTETGMISMATPGEMLRDPDVRRTVGKPPTAVLVDVRDGELYVRTPSQASGYWNDPDETAAVFRDGWVRTRDLGSVDENGYVRLRGRARDVIIVHAELVYAGPIERVLAEDPAVAEAYVVGGPDDDSGEAVHAFLVPAAGAHPDPDTLRTAVAARLGDKAAPSTVTVIAGVPVAPSGKPDKKALLRHLAG